MGARKGRVLIGTSGWHYDHWRGPFYPDDLPEDRWLAFYRQRFSTVEINNSFYQLPSRATLEAWREEVPRRFVFAAKASRYITHMKKLKDPAEPLGNFFERMEALGDRLGPILFQLPPRWKANPERLEAFLTELPRGRRCAFEFRDESWFAPEAYEVLAARGAAFCIYELAGRTSPREVTADFAYVRLHGPASEKYRGRYDRRTLGGWAGAFAAWNRQGKDVYCYFDNDQDGYAAINAGELQEMVGG